MVKALAFRRREVVMPAQAGNQVRIGEVQRAAWIPASAGKTEKEKVDFKSTGV
jgi:hypothetical protein